MQQVKYISNSEVEVTKKLIEDLYKKKKTIVISFKKSRNNIKSYSVTIEGVYVKFFTVRDEKLKANFTIQYFDLITGEISISNK